MKSQILFSIATCITLLTSVSLPVVAETIPNPVQPTNNTNNITLAKNTAIIVSFPSSMTVDVSEKQDFPLTVFLTKAITDSQGNVLVPENSPVSIILKPTDKGAKIVAQSLVVNGRVVSIQASSPTIPGATITHKAGHEKAEEDGSVWGKIGESAFGFAGGGKPEHSERGSMLGKTLGLVTGLNSPTKSRQVKINENSVYVLSLEASVDLSAR
ncbi:hypothetical protein IQ247_01835 [Plectonema cf. radiosum LEGE 06105]|uniref:Uncharacterized protein n=1 Tax=Plectonema cf. radiosum LEGE 06105 TaxID=945769 RepID=A0A8J7EX96_9CYAN|nr:hypothetical protein [Plectonema radiosum]MBE9211468.1 hypothetical protein [Plectonema cf. radiosum LEGE 06105]